MSVRSYRDEDYDAVCAFLIELNQKDRTHINWNWARFEWLLWQGFDHGESREAFERSSDHAPHVRKHFNRTLSLSAADPSGEPVSH